MIYVVLQQIFSLHLLTVRSSYNTHAGRACLMEQASNASNSDKVRVGRETTEIIINKIPAVGLLPAPIVYVPE